MKNLDELMKVIDKIIEDDLLVDMEQFRSENGRPSDFYTKDDCGTAGCILGWCPVVGEGVLTSEVSMETLANGIYSLSNDWDTYSYEVFGLDSCSDEWYWIFSSYWHNDAHHAKARLQFLIDNGRPPKDFHEGTTLITVHTFIHTPSEEWT